MIRRHQQRRYSDIKMNLALHIRDFGPISDANISLKPLTIFVGPNNSGKSHTSTLIHSVVSACTKSIPYDYSSRLTAQALDKLMPMSDRIKQLTLKEKETVVPDALINEIARTWIEIIFNNELPVQIENDFATKIKDLVRINKTTFSIDLFNSNQIHVGYKNKILSAHDSSMPILKIIINTENDPRSAISVNNNADGSITFTLAAQLPESIKISILVEELYHTVSNKIRLGIPPQSHYLSAARSGILQSHRAITGCIIRDAPYVSINRMQYPPVSGIISDFISSILLMPLHRGKFYSLAENLESSMLNGRIHISRDRYRVPEIKYKFLNRDISLHNTSSTVSEMAPLILYLKYIIKEGDLLIIEEPEAHLHPVNQVILARHMARLIRSGLNILITTHSQFLLEQLSLLVQAGHVDQKVRDDMGLDSDEFLMVDEVSPYLFTQITPGNCTANPIECSSDEGISQDEFVKVQEKLYNQTLRQSKEKWLKHN